MSERDKYPPLEIVRGEVTICSACLDGEGGECHTPGCLFWLNRAPDLGIRWKLEAHECSFERLPPQDVLPPAVRR